MHLERPQSFRSRELILQGNEEQILLCLHSLGLRESTVIAALYKLASQLEILSCHVYRDNYACDNERPEVTEVLHFVNPEALRCEPR